VLIDRLPSSRTHTSGLADVVHDNVANVAADTEGAARELTQASEYQRKAGRRAACLMIILVIVTAVVLLAVRCIPLSCATLKLTLPSPGSQLDFPPTIIDVTL